ncbi:MAG TPA: HDOD domain-containing protein [Acidimicrobiales bacterium]|nr:HDOD domain-containing protein [Acidimicrobiales bacterium]
MEQPTTTTEPAAAPSTRRLVRSMEALAANPTVALQVMWACDDPRSSARSVGESTETDPILTARLLRLANSAMYALRVPVTNGHRAVAVLGFSTVRALAAVVTGGEHIQRVPDGFWEHSAAVAAAARSLAPRLGVPADDAFAVGLLHEMGVALLEGLQPGGWVLVEAAGGGRDAELGVFGITHADATAQVFTAWRLPSSMVEAVAGHTGRVDESSPALLRALVAAEAVADLAVGPWGPCSSSGGTAALESLGLDDIERDRIVAQVRDSAADLAGALLG